MGGGSGALNRFAFEQDDGDHEPPFVSKMVGIRIRRGQRLRLETPGGGGYGPVDERSRESVARDLRLGYVTPEGAQRDYGVVVAGDGSIEPEAGE